MPNAERGLWRKVTNFVKELVNDRTPEEEERIRSILSGVITDKDRSWYALERFCQIAAKSGDSSNPAGTINESLQFNLGVEELKRIMELPSEQLGPEITAYAREQAETHDLKSSGKSPFQWE